MALLLLLKGSENNKGMSGVRLCSNGSKNGPLDHELWPAVALTAAIAELAKYVTL